MPKLHIDEGISYDILVLYEFLGMERYDVLKGDGRLNQFCWSDLQKEEKVFSLSNFMTLALDKYLDFVLSELE